MPFERVIAVGSGKGGVGKSTVSLNLAVALAEEGESVALLDADLFGPSIPLMTGLQNLTPKVENERVIPFKKFGIEILSPGFFLEESTPVVWRGPMLHQMLEKMLMQTAWENTTLIIDLPPGTGDVPISLSQLLKIDGAIVVSTPHPLSTLDAQKAINAFALLDIPLLGVVQNMGEEEPFSLAEKFATPLLGSFPYDAKFGEDACRGIPSLPLFQTLAQNLLEKL
ncbi:MAG: P-loop NTPase [Chlamydiales bacterium]|nr:P-loop NTPase [Chlamydiales bacterium]